MENNDDSIMHQDEEKDVIIGADHTINHSNEELEEQECHGSSVRPK